MVYLRLFIKNLSDCMNVRFAMDCFQRLIKCMLKFDRTTSQRNRQDLFLERYVWLRKTAIEAVEIAEIASTSLKFKDGQ